MMRSSALRVARTLRRQHMPVTEIRAIITTSDPELIGRYLELHRERLEERLAEQRDDLAALDDVLGPSVQKGFHTGRDREGLSRCTNGSNPSSPLSSAPG
jgi:hypothetical protein